MSKKHYITKTVNGKKYSYYRRAETYRGRKFDGTAKNSTEWVAKYETFKRDVDSAFVLTDPKMTVNQLAELFLDEAKSGLRPKSIEERESKLRIYILPVIGHLKLRDVTSGHIDAVLDDAEDVSPSTLEHVHKVCNRMFEFCIENQYVLTQNPISKGQTKRVNRIVASSRETTSADDVGLSLEEIAFLLKEAEGQHHEIVFHWQLLHGLRIAEALGMMWEDIDFEKNTISVYRDVSDTSRSTVKGSKWADDGVGPIITATKTPRSRREIPLQEPTIAILEHTPAEDRHGYVYSTANGTPHMPNNYRKRVFNPIRERLDITWATTHDLRKAFGSVLLVNGVDIMTVSHWMGHSSPAVTMKIYAKILPEAEKWHSKTIGTALFR